MNKIIVLLIFVIVVLTILLGASLPLGTQEYKSENNGITIKIPRLSKFQEECCMFAARFTSLRSTYSLKKQIERELENYQKITCNDKTYYYDKEQDFTITEYYVKNKPIYNEFGIIYTPGNYCADITRKNIGIEGTASKEEETVQLISPAISSSVYPLDYNLFSYGFAEVRVVINGETFLLSNALRSNRVTIAELVDYMEKGAEVGDWEKLVYRDGGSIYYPTETFGFLKCNTVQGNKDYYIINPVFNKSIGLCQ